MKQNNFKIKLLIALCPFLIFFIFISAVFQPIEIVITNLALIVFFIFVLLKIF